MSWPIWKWTKCFVVCWSAFSTVLRHIHLSSLHLCVWLCVCFGLSYPPWKNFPPVKADSTRTKKGRWTQPEQWGQRTIWFEKKRRNKSKVYHSSAELFQLIQCFLCSDINVISNSWDYSSTVRLYSCALWSRTRLPNKIPAIITDKWQWEWHQRAALATRRTVSGQFIALPL